MHTQYEYSIVMDFSSGIWDFFKLSCLIFMPSNVWTLLSVVPGNGYIWTKMFRDLF